MIDVDLIAMTGLPEAVLARERESVTIQYVSYRIILQGYLKMNSPLMKFSKWLKKRKRST